MQPHQLANQNDTGSFDQNDTGSFDQYQSIFPPTYLSNEHIRKQPVTKADIAKTKKLLREFGVTEPYGFKVLCNSFKSYAELENWRRYYIKNELDRMESEGLITDELPD